MGLFGKIFEKKQRDLSLRRKRLIVKVFLVLSFITQGWEERSRFLIVNI
jgi:hypothetical protein